jgi:uncharacterized repeat protein (TIGR01451 family)
VTFQVSVAGTASGTIANVATVSTPPGSTDTTPGNNTGTATITVGLVADLGISKTASTATPSAGGTLTFSLVITNAGPSTATSATFADTLPTGLGTIANVVSATGGGATTGSFNIGTSTLRRHGDASPGWHHHGDLPGQRGGHGQRHDSQRGDGEHTAGHDRHHAGQQHRHGHHHRGGLVADLGISKTASTATPSAGGTLTFSLVITNAGPSTATSATFADTLPTGLGTIANVVSATGGGATTGSFNIGTSNPQRHGDASPGWHHHGDLPGQRGGHGQRHDSQRGDGEHTAGHDRHHAGQQHRHGHHHRGAGGGPGHQQDGQHRPRRARAGH